MAQIVNFSSHFLKVKIITSKLCVSLESGLSLSCIEHHYRTIPCHSPYPLPHTDTHPSLESFFDSLTGLLHYFLIQSVCIMLLLLKKSYNIFWIEFVIFLLPHRLAVVSLVPMDSNSVQMMLFFQPELRKLVMEVKLNGHEIYV